MGLSSRQPFSINNLMKNYIIFIIFLVFLNGCASSKIYIDSDKVEGLGAVVNFPSGKIIPITVKEVISGNEILLSNKERVVYIGVFIPEISGIPKEALLLNSRLISDADIRFEFDKKQRDLEGRLLAYVFTKGKQLVNAELIRSGFAQAFLSPVNTKHNDKLLNAEEEAKDKELGIWSKQIK